MWRHHSCRAAEWKCWVSESFIQVENIEEVLATIDPEHLLAKPVHDFLYKCGLETSNMAKERAPHDTGRLWSSLGTDESIEIDNAEIPLWVMVGTNVNAEGFPYPKALDESDRYHYRGRSQTALFGTETKDWFSGTPALLTGRYKELSDAMLEDIAERWGK